MKKFLLLAAALCTLGMAAQSTLTVFDGTDTSNRVPFDSFWWDASSPFYTQVIYPAEELAEMEGATITGIKFYLSGNGVQFSGGTYDLQLGTTTETAFTAEITNGLTNVLTGQTAPASGLLEVELTFENPFVYEGGNLLYSCHVTAKGSYGSSYFYGVKQSTYTAWARNAGASFIPKTTFIYTPAPMPDYKVAVSPKELNFGKVCIAEPGASSTLNVTLRNKGLNTVTPAVTLDAPFSTTYEAAPLASEETVEIPVTFAPTELGEFTGTMTINCGQAGEVTVPLSGIGSEEMELTICDGEDVDPHLPFYCLYYDTPNTLSQMIYPAEMLTEVKNGKITGVKFYLREVMQLSGGQLEVSLGETENIEYIQGDEGLEGVVTDLTPVLTTPLASGGSLLEFNFDTPYAYNGGNLTLQTRVVESSGWNAQYFYGTNVDYFAGFNQVPSAASASTTLVKFLPKMTISYIKGQEEPAYYVVGGFNGWDEENGVEVTEEGATIDVVQQDFNNPDDTAQEFKIITTDADGNLVWLGGVDNNNVGYFMIEDSMLDSPISLDNAGANFRLPEPGNYTIHLAFLEKSTVSGLIMFVTKNQVTGVNGIADKTVAGVKYYNLTGIESSKPFKGINIVVTTYTDGTTSTTKVVK